MGTYKYYKLGKNGKEIFKNTVTNGYLHFDAHGNWNVRNTNSKNSVYIIAFYSYSLIFPIN